jgi:uncharacterized membrane protein
MSWVHVHLLLNHVPVIGIFGAVLVLAVGIVRRSQDVIRLGLGLVVLVAAASIVVYLTGEPAEHLVERLPGISEAAIEAHEQAAFAATAVMALLGIGVAAGLFAYRRGARVPRWFAIWAMALSVVAAGMMTWNAGLGGQIRHSEIRRESAPAALEQQAEPQPAEPEETRGT